MAEKPTKAGRPVAPPASRKNKHALSMTDAEWQDLVDKAHDAELSISQYVVKKLRLNATPKPKQP